MNWSALHKEPQIKRKRYLTAAGEDSERVSPKPRGIQAFHGLSFSIICVKWINDGETSDRRPAVGRPRIIK
ncbi:hypothetical protein TNCV_967781 [Trichonephila clavipes]|nr:hypothetical protein TNCV_967781 [Trichonephila clavipes]